MVRASESEDADLIILAKSRREVRIAALFSAVGPTGRFKPLSIRLWR
jgi:hypothetical protein